MSEPDSPVRVVDCPTVTSAPPRSPSPLDRLDNDNTSAYDVIMIRTQISLTEAEYRAAKKEAKRLGISLAELLRRSLRTMLPVDESRPWMRYAGMIESGDPNASQTIDEIVYGEKG